MLKLNSKAPNFTLSSTNKTNYSLKNSSGKYVVIYFYPKDDTPGCTIEANDFNKLLPQFKKLNCEVFGISKDNLKSHDKYRARRSCRRSPRPIRRCAGFPIRQEDCGASSRR